MTRFQALDVQESIHVPATRVWFLLTDWVAAPKWMPGVDSMEAEQLTTTPGTVLDYRSGEHERQLVITELEDGQSITLATGSGDVSVLYSYELSEGSGQTTVRLLVSVEAAAELEDEVGELLAAIADSESGTLKALRIYAEAAP
ncbi:SRPBCC family protein [Paeniglutamicibacter sp. NPDC091659]|uniref:SRPBCC family protein n=1 Tax=Paeniglutamicibacter sp. NPDC091659 TaxID=3364389 RepID=UPI00381C2864